MLVKVDNKTVIEINIDQEQKNKIYEFEFDNNIGYIEVENGAARVLEMDRSICPRGICSQFGWKNGTYETIVCLPNSIVISFEELSDELDIVSY